MEFEVLGPIRVRPSGETTASLSPKARVLLAVLLSRANSAVPVDVLVDALWRGQRVDNGKQKLQLHVHQLRKALGDGDRVRHAAQAYTLTVLPGELDAERFETLLGEGREAVAAGDAQQGCELFRKALALWSGEPYTGGGDSLDVSHEAQRLSGLRLTAIEELYTAELACGRHAEVVPELDDVVRQHPLHEGLRALAMIALYRSGRPADALRVYREGRRAMVDELGLEPGPQLRRVEAAILAGEDVDLGTGADRTPSPARMIRPAQLPPDLSHFTGRSEQLAALLALGGAGSETVDRPVRVAAVDGMAGVGKTSLVVHAARQLASSFPDGQIFLGLNGFTEAAAPVEPAEALDRLLRSIGVDGRDIPADVHDRTALWRSLVAGQRLLVVLDNAASEAQVRPLLPAAPGCLVLITSRRRLSGLDDVALISLDVLPTDDAVTLFRQVAGPGRVPDGSTEQLEEIVGLSGRLPLAVRIAAARLRDRPAWRLDDLIARLRDQQEALDELEAGDRSVAGAFRLSYLDLDDTSRLMFRRLGLHAGPDLDAYAAAALADVPVRTARRVLDGLLDVHLLEQRAPERYQLHDLLLGYAARLAESEDSEADRRDAVGRLLEHYTGRAADAMSRLQPEDDDVRFSLRSGPDFIDTRAASAWLEAEYGNLMAASDLAATHDHPAIAISLSEILALFLKNRCAIDHAILVHERALDAARRIADRSAEGRALRRLATTYRTAGDHRTAAELCEQAVAACRLAGDVVGEYGALFQSAAVELYLGDLATGRDHLEQARSLDPDRTIVPPKLAASALSLLAIYSKRFGDLEAAAQQAEEGLRVASDLGTWDRALALSTLGTVRQAQGRHDEAIDALRTSLGLYEETGDPAGKSLAISLLGASLHRSGRPDEAIERYREALAIARDIANRNAQGEANRGMGIVLRDIERFDEALHHLEQALDLAYALAQPLDIACTHDELAHLMLARGELGLAREHWQRALEIMTEIGLPDAGRVRRELAGLSERAG